MDTMSVAPTPLLPVSRIMYNAERGLFDLRQGRPLFITDKGASPSDGGLVSGALVAAVDGLDLDSLDRFRAMGNEALRLVVTAHRIASMGLSPAEINELEHAGYSIPLRRAVNMQEILALACSSDVVHETAAIQLSSATPGEAAGLSLVRLSRLLPAVVAMPAGTPPASRIDEALSTGELLSVDVGEVNEYYTASSMVMLLRLVKPQFP